MTVLAADFIIAFPAFAQADTTLVQTHLDMAALEIDPNVWDDLVTVGTMYLAAHNLALSPYGQAVRMVQDKGETTYGKKFKELQRSVCKGFRVT